MCNGNSNHEHTHGDTHSHEHEHTHAHQHYHDGQDHSHEHTHMHEHDHGHNHDGGNTHGHSHEEYHCHDDNHNHEHKCESVVDSLTKEEKTLKLLLSHWIDHNKSHEQGFEEWVEKSKQMGKLGTADFIHKAIEFMKKADEMLLEAQNHM